MKVCVYGSSRPCVTAHDFFCNTERGYGGMNEWVGWWMGVCVAGDMGWSGALTVFSKLWYKQAVIGMSPTHYRRSEDFQEEAMTHLRFKNVLVRVDDLKPLERERVVEVAGLITGITGRQDVPTTLTPIAVAVVLIGWAIYAIAIGTKLPLVYIVPMLVSMFMAGFLVYNVAASICFRYNARDASMLVNPVGVYPRCRELLDAYIAVNPKFAKLLPESLIQILHPRAV